MLATAVFPEAAAWQRRQDSDQLIAQIDTLYGWGSLSGHLLPRVVGIQCRIVDLHGLLELVAGAGQVPQVPQHAAEISPPGADGGVVGAQGRLADLHGSLQLVAGAGQVP